MIEWDENISDREWRGVRVSEKIRYYFLFGGLREIVVRQKKIAGGSSAIRDVTVLLTRAARVEPSVR